MHWKRNMKVVSVVDSQGFWLGKYFFFWFLVLVSEFERHYLKANVCSMLISADSGRDARWCWSLRRSMFKIHVLVCESILPFEEIALASCWSWSSTVFLGKTASCWWSQKYAFFMFILLFRCHALRLRKLPGVLERREKTENWYFCSWRKLKKNVFF